MRIFKGNYIIYFFILSLLVIGGSYAFRRVKNDGGDIEMDNIKQLQEQIKGMTLREKIAQMLIVYADGTKLTDEFKDELITNQVGGFIIFSNNISTFANTTQLISNLQEGIEIPMFIATDQEGGRVQRLLSVTDKEATDILPMSEIGEINNLDLSYGIGTIIGEETRALGINCVFAPVLDVGNVEVSSMKDRIISNDPQIVARNGLVIGKGIQDAGVIPVYKHFPGIANTIVDSHYALPVIMKNKDELYAEELIPFKKAIDEEAVMMMIGHVSYPLVTGNDLPASLSKEIITDLLRDELNYDGVVITDAVNMKALTDNYSQEEIYELGINAGVDIFLMPDGITSTIDLIEKLVLEEKVSETKIDDAVLRILKLKAQYLDDFTILDEVYFGSVSHQNILEKYR